MISISRGYSSVVEHLTADQEVPGSIPCAPLPVVDNRKTHFSLLFLFDVVKIKYAISLLLFWAFGCMGYGLVLEHLTADEEVPGSNLGAALGFGEILE